MRGMTLLLLCKPHPGLGQTRVRRSRGRRAGKREGGSDGEKALKTYFSIPNDGWLVVANVAEKSEGKKNSTSKK